MRIKDKYRYNLRIRVLKSGVQMGSLPLLIPFFFLSCPILNLKILMVNPPKKKKKEVWGT